MNIQEAVAVMEEAKREREGTSAREPNPNYASTLEARAAPALYEWYQTVSAVTRAVLNTDDAIEVDKRLDRIAVVMEEHGYGRVHSVDLNAPRIPTAKRTPPWDWLDYHLAPCNTWCEGGRNGKCKNCGSVWARHLFRVCPGCNAEKTIDNFLESKSGSLSEPMVVLTTCYGCRTFGDPTHRKLNELREALEHERDDKENDPATRIWAANLLKETFGDAP